MLLCHYCKYHFRNIFKTLISCTGQLWQLDKDTCFFAIAVNTILEIFLKHLSPVQANSGKLDKDTCFFAIAVTSELVISKIMFIILISYAGQLQQAGRGE